MEKKTFSYEFKQLTEDEDFFFIEGIVSDNSIDRADDIVTSGSVIDSVNKFGLPKFFYQHNSNDPIGVWESIKQVGAQTIGIAKLPKGCQDIEKIVKLVKMGAMGGFSIGFNILEKPDFKDEVRIIKEIEVLEISLVSIPCNSNAIITGVKSDKTTEESKVDFDSIESLSDLEDAIKKEWGKSNTDSKGFISAVTRLKKLDVQREADELEAEKQERDALEATKSLEELTNIGKKFITLTGDK
ncbi:MAG: HK97 family phage prohead protease [Candidatus Heimdallarchaeota archaeon]